MSYSEFQVPNCFNSRHAASPQGQARLKLYVKLAAAGFALYFGVVRAMALQPAAIAPANFVWNTMWVLAAGATVLGFISDRTQDHALGDGHLLLIASSVISSAHLHPLAPGRVNPTL